MIYDVIIIGGGPAGITAGIYALRERLKTLLITKDFGGQLLKKAVDIENYPGFERISAPELIRRFKNHLKSYKAELVIDQVTKINKEKYFFVFTQGGKRFVSKTVIVASGANPRSIDIPGEKEFLGRGVSYCPLCDAPFFKNKIVSIIGGGNAGLEAGILLSKWAKKVYILEASPTIKADKINQERVRAIKNIKTLTSVEPKEIRGNRFVNSITFLDKKKNKTISLKVDGVFIEIGFIPATDFVKDLVEFNEINEIKVNPETYETKTPGLFAVGDCNVGKYKQIITACGEGAKGALSASEYIKRNY